MLAAKVGQVLLPAAPGVQGVSVDGQVCWEERLGESGLWFMLTDSDVQISELWIYKWL